MKLLLVLPSAILLHAATSVSVFPTATQAVIQVRTDQDGVCTYQASEGAVIAAPVNDVDTTKFAGSNSDARPKSVVGPSAHFFVLGTRTADRAFDGKWYSRALQANTPHTVQVTCGSDVVTKPFTTRNPPFGDIAGETLPFDPTAPYNAALPSIDLSMTSAGGITTDTGQATKYIDPLTGIQLVRVTGAMQGSALSTLNGGIPPTAFDPAGAWTTPLNAVGNSGFATIGTAGADSALFIPFGLPANINFAPYGQWDTRRVIDDMNLSLNASGSSATAADRVMLACVSLHHGATCDTDTFTISNIPQTTPTQVNFPNTGSPTVWNPFWKLWTAASPYPAPIDLGTRTGTATMSGSTITWVSGALFSNRLAPGDRIQLVGSGCNNGGTDYCTVASVADSKHIVTVESQNVAAPAAFTVQNAGLRIWKGNGSGTVSLNTTKYYAAIGTGYGTGANEQKDTCSPNTFSLAANRDGSARSPAVNARLCQFSEADGLNTAYVWVPSTGEAWHIANGATTYPGPGPGGVGTPDYMGNGGRCDQGGPAWHPTDPFTWYCGSNSGVGPIYSVVLKFTYNYVAGAGSCNGREWNDATYGTVPENPCVGIVNDTLASTGHDLVTLVKNLDSSFDSTYFSRIVPIGGFGKYIAYELRSANQNTYGYMAWYDTQAKTIAKVADTVTTWPLRWTTLHGNLLVHSSGSAWSMVSEDAPNNYRSGQVGSDQSEMQILSIAGKAGADLPINYFTACPAGLDARWVAVGATAGAMKCVQITVDGEPRLENPSAADKAHWPASALNAAWSQISPIMEGDGIKDTAQANGAEVMLVVKKTAGSGNQIILDLLRSPAWPGCPVSNYYAHGSSWVPITYPPNMCLDGGAYWVNVTGSAAPVPEIGSLGLAHVDSSGIGPNGPLVTASGTVRQGMIPATVGTNGYPANIYNAPFHDSDPSAGSFIVQSHPSSRQVKAPLSEQGWTIDGHPYGGAIGSGGISPICSFGSIALQGGTTTVYKLILAGGTCPATLDMKNFPLEVTAGRFMLRDISSPAIGNQVTDLTPYRWCYARLTNECRTGSSIGDIYASIPFGETGTACSFNNFDINAPCVFAKYGVTGNIVQWDVTTPDPKGEGARRLGYGLTVPTHPASYWSGTSDPDGQWAFFSPSFADNMLLNHYFAYKLPPAPIRRDSISRNRYVNVPIPILNGVAGESIRVQFGYAEFGPVDGSANSLYCTSRAEACYTTASPTSTNPFVFAGETQSYTACNPNCTVQVPALSGHIVYYTYERKNGLNISHSGQVEVKAAN